MLIASSAQPEGPVAVIDSGMGGISVLVHLVRHLACERFVFFGDSAYTPYGEKPVPWVVERTRELADRQIEAGAKAIVVACNTATSAAAQILRDDYVGIPIVGIEPALKPAVRACSGGRVLVMATPMTLRLEKFQHLADQWGGGATVVPLACTGLAAAIEEDGPDSKRVFELVEQMAGAYRGTIDAVVLGCTHYPLARRAIRAVLGAVPIFDGADGTARQLERVLRDGGLLAPEGSGGVAFETSAEDAERTCALYRRLYETYRSSILFKE